ncbi:MAG TPA: hypothetical protein VG916_02900 [Gemmatimonadaceae bacterium]|nr:hypothetical protein [Gemmatimonadaceae bacterium]
MNATVAVALVVGVLVLALPRWFARTRDTLGVYRALRERRKARHVNWSAIAAYDERVAAAPEEDRLSERVWRDLDLAQVFLSVDYTASEPGRQTLYHRLRRPATAAEPVMRLDAVARALSRDPATADAARRALARLSDHRASGLEALMFGEVPRRPALWWCFPLLTLGAFACLALIAVWPRLVLGWLAVCAVNVVVQVTYKPRVRAYVPALHELPGFLAAARELGTLRMPGLADEVQSLREGAAQLGSLRLATRWLMFEPGQANDLAASLYEYVNLLFLLDVNAFVFSTNALRTHAPLLRRMFEALGTIDVAQSVATWRATLPTWSTPEFTPPAKALQAEGVYHPLLADPVPNTIAIDGGGVLITGSNMSGKTTFVRALGVNAVLAQSLATACASAWRAPLLRVRTSITGGDSLADGKSYYLAEIESVLALVRAKEGGRQHLFLLDELFRGTNTTERVAAAYAVLAHLDQGLDITVVATHDLELLGLLRGTYALQHFTETVAGDDLTFTYRIRPGPSTTRNAIALLKVMQYPEAIVARAMALVDGHGGPAT